MTIKEQIMNLQTYKMYEGEESVYVERDDVIKALEQQSRDCTSEEVIDIILSIARNLEHICEVMRNDTGRS